MTQEELADIEALFPAWAGVIPEWKEITAAAAAFPRMGGGDPLHGSDQASEAHFSPHGRG